MTINVGRAINRFTGIQVTVQYTTQGFWDENNRWVDGALTDPLPVLATVTPIGHSNDEGIYGRKLEPREEGDRESEYIRVVTVTEIPINSIVHVYGKDYKCTRLGDFQGYGYNVAICRYGGATRAGR